MVLRAVAVSVDLALASYRPLVDPSHTGGRTADV